jgi:hypothetical protein
MTLAPEAGIDRAPAAGHSCSHMPRATASSFTGYFGFFSPKTLGGCPDA